MSQDITPETVITDVGSGTRPVAGDIAHDSADSGNPLKVGGKARNANPTEVANADRVDAFFDLMGKLLVVQGNYINVDGVSLPVKQAAIDETGTDSEVIALVSSKKLRIVAITFTCSAACTVLFESGTATTKVAAMSFAANGGMDVNRAPHGYFLETNAGESFTVTVSAGNIRGSCCYVEV